MLAELVHEALPNKIWLSVQLPQGPHLFIRLHGGSIEVDTRTAKTVTERGSVEFPDELLPLLRAAAEPYPDIPEDQMDALRAGLAQVLPPKP